jgi:hypothetical protein
MNVPVGTKDATLIREEKAQGICHSRHGRGLTAETGRLLL